MAIIEVTKDNFKSEVLENKSRVLVDFNADWCGPCKMLHPTLEEVAKENDNIKIASLNIDDESELAEEYEIMSIPCLVLFENGQEIERKIGLMPREEIEGMIGAK